jgi:hypothetical protein
MDMEGVEMDVARKICVALGKEWVGLCREDKRGSDSPETCGELDVNGS